MGRAGRLHGISGLPGQKKELPAAESMAHKPREGFLYALGSMHAVADCLMVPACLLAMTSYSGDDCLQQRLYRHMFTA